MPGLSGIYDSAWIQPVAKIKENLSIWTQGAWEHYIIDYQEPIPPSPATIIDMVPLAAPAITSLVAAGTIAKQAVAALQLSKNEFVHLRWEPLENVEGVLWEQASQGRFITRRVHARVDRRTRLWDPHLVTTTFWILSQNRDMNLEVRNPMAYATPIARFIFWGYRMLLTPWDFSKASAADQKLLSQGDLETVKRYLSATTWLPAEGR